MSISAILSNVTTTTFVTRGDFERVWKREEVKKVKKILWKKHPRNDSAVADSPNRMY